MASKIVTRICQDCGTPFPVKAFRLAHGRGKYCSRPCRNRGISSHRESTNGVRSPEYMAWTSMKTRCLNPADRHYPNYGGRGITICGAWQRSFKSFLTDVGRRPSPNHSLDRYPDNNGNYEPGNVRWATALEQSHNRRTNRLVTFRGTTQCVNQWARETGIPSTTLLRRLSRWSVEQSLTAPLRRRP